MVITLIASRPVTGNAQAAGGQLYSPSGSIVITNNVFNGNIASDQGGGAWAESDDTGPLTFTNNTLYGNTATNYGGGVYLYLFAPNVQANVYNNIFWTNVASHGGNDGDDLYVNSNPESLVGAAVALFNNDFSGNADFTSGQSEDLFITNTDNYT